MKVSEMDKVVRWWNLRAVIVLIAIDMMTELYTISLEFYDALYNPWAA